MANIVPQCRQINCYLDGKILLGDIEEVNVPDIEMETEEVRVGDATVDVETGLAKMAVELKGHDIQPAVQEAFARAAGKPNTQLKICATLENDVQASWKFRGLLTNIPTTFMPTTTLKLNANFYEHIIDSEEKYYIDILNDIRRIDGKDRLTAIREAIGI